MRILLLLVSLIGSATFAAELNDMLTVKLVSGQHATLEGNTAKLKTGDKVYFSRSPFQFTVTNVNGNMATISLPANSDLAVGQTMLREPTDAIKKAMNTEDKLKKALEE